MDLDIRVPIGALFLVLGGLLVSYGLVAPPETLETHSLGVNIDLWWGAAMAVFGSLMLGLVIGRRRR